jgi:hypothetical protein
MYYTYLVLFYNTIKRSINVENVYLKLFEGVFSPSLPLLFIVLFDLK